MEIIGSLLAILMLLIFAAMFLSPFVFAWWAFKRIRSLTKRVSELENARTVSEDSDKVPATIPEVGVVT